MHKEEEGERIRESLRVRGWAVVRVRSLEAVVLREAAGAAREFFVSTPVAQKQQWQFSYGEQGLVGWSDPPLSAKEVLRCRRGAADKVPSCPVDLRTAAAAAFDVVERVSELVFHDDEEAGGSVFDFMYYPNTPSSLPNSTPHVDSPGILTVVPVSSSPGLIVLDQLTKEWIDVESIYEPYADCIVLVSSNFPAYDPQLTPTTHAVRKHTEPRLSLVYEHRRTFPQERWTT